MVNCLRAFVQLNTFPNLPQEFEFPTSTPSLTTYTESLKLGGRVSGPVPTPHPRWLPPK